MTGDFTNITNRIASDKCSHCGGPAPHWKCPACGTVSPNFDPSHWRNCPRGTKMQAQCAACGQAEEKCTCQAA